MQSRNVLLQQVQSTHENMLNSFLYQIENQMKYSMSYTINLALFETDPQILAYSNDESDVQYAKLRVLNELSEKIISNNLIDAYFIITRDNKDELDFIMVSQSSNSTIERRAVREYLLSVIDTIDENLFSGDMNWNIATINDNDCLVQISAYKQEIFVGTYINMKHLISNFDQDADTGVTLLCIPDSQIENLVQRIDGDDMLMITQHSSLTSFSLVELVPNVIILRSLPFMQKYIVLISIISVMVLPILILILRRIVINPLMILTKAMNYIHNGNMDYRIPPYHTSNELNLVNHTFNQMINQVQHLKIVVYEEQIKAQRSQLRNLQLQIKPHFLINSLNMVYNFINNEDYDLAVKLIRYSVDYFRYMVKIDEDFVPLNEELDHVKTFLEIQSIRYKDKFTFSFDVDKQIDDMLIPPVLIQSFVENSIKYAIQMSKPIHINISVSSFEREYYPYATIVISDTGPGYPQEYLQLLNQGKKIIDNNGEHIGIRNAIQRLAFLFNGNAKWHFYNNNGAISQFIIPATFDISE
jgi:two-component system sensor histidine kinase YesM